MNQRETDVKNRVRAVAFADSAHNIWHQDTSKGTQDWMQQVARWWDEQRRVKEKRRDLEISACCARLYRPHGSEEGQLTSLPGSKIQGAVASGQKKNVEEN
ncbi:Protein FAM172A [Takifugu flavidus]|uniref:Protein FAM172A n=1 Tax=Takifugu flavidus TaxID=433684 RepID=A0A5C6N2T4_9TELE|nr:Protein FAM172A [Takifugu flavidus]